MKIISALPTLLLFLPLFCFTQISLNLGGSSVTLYRDQQLKIDFKATGGTGAYQFIYRNVPFWWKIVGNSIVIEQFARISGNEGRVEVEVRDISGNYVIQTIGITFMGVQVRLVAVTLPITGTLSPTITSPTQISSPSTPVPTISEAINNYPGLTEIDRLLNNFLGERTQNSTSTSTATTTTPVQTNQNLTNSSNISILEQQRQSAIIRYNIAEGKVNNLTNIGRNLVDVLKVMEIERNRVDGLVNESKVSVSQCDSELFELEDRQVKLGNAIKDKQAQLQQSQDQLKDSNEKLNESNKKIANLESKKATMEAETLPNSSSLTFLINALQSCKESLANNVTTLSASNLQVANSQAQIQALKMEKNEAGSKIAKMRVDLSTIDSQITDLERQLGTAKKEKDSVSNDMKNYERILSENDDKILKIEKQISELSTLPPQINSEICKEYENRISNIQSILNSNAKDYNTLLESINALHKETALITEQINNLKTVSQALPIELTTLTAELDASNHSISLKSFLCDDKINKYSRNAMDLNNLVDRINTSQVELNNVLSDLQASQSELRLAADALSQLGGNQVNGTGNNVANTPTIDEIIKGTQQPTQNVQGQSQFTIDGFLNAQSQQQQSSSVTNSPSRVNLTGNILNNEFKLTRTSGQVFAEVLNTKNYFKENFNFNMDTVPLQQTTRIYSIDSLSLQRLIPDQTVRERLPTFECQNSTVSDWGLIESIGVGFILARSNRNTLYRITFGDCTELASMGQTGSIEIGVRIYFRGVPLVSLPGNILLNAHLIVSTSIPE